MRNVLSIFLRTEGTRPVRVILAQLPTLVSEAAGIPSGLIARTGSASFIVTTPSQAWAPVADRVNVPGSAGLASDAGVETCG